MASDYTLYCFAQSGNAYKVALMLQLCGAAWKPRFVDFFNGEARTPEFRAINVMGEVPVLLHGDKTLTQSGVILDYLAETLGKFGPDNDEERREILRWTLFDNHKLTANIATLRFLMNFVEGADPAVIKFLAGRVKAALMVLNAHLADHSFIVAERPTIADFSLCGYLYWPHEFNVSWDAYPNIPAWLGRIAALPGWQHPYELMPGYPLPPKPAA